MQKWDPLIAKPENHQLNKNYLVPCSVDLDTNIVTIFGYYRFSMLHREGLFMNCKVPWFNKTKTAIYKEFLPSRNRFRLIWKNPVKDKIEKISQGD